MNKKKNKTYRVPVIWQMCRTLDITASSLEDAIEVANELPITTGQYVDDSFEIEEELIECLEDVKSERSVHELTKAERVKLGEHFGCSAELIPFEFINGNLQLFPNKEASQKAVLQSLGIEKVASLMMKRMDIFSVNDKGVFLTLETGEVVCRFDLYEELLDNMLN